MQIYNECTDFPVKLFYKSLMCNLTIVSIKGEVHRVIHCYNLPTEDFEMERKKLLAEMGDAPIFALQLTEMERWSRG